MLFLAQKQNNNQQLQKQTQALDSEGGRIPQVVQPVVSGAREWLPGCL